MKFYKLTNKYNCSNYMSGKLKIQYIPNIWVKSPFAKYGYGICVFDHLASVQLYLSDFNPIYAYKNTKFYLRIWEIDVKHQMTLPTSLLWFHVNQMYDMITSYTSVSIPDTLQWPEGTLMFQEIKLLKDVTNDVL